MPSTLIEFPNRSSLAMSRELPTAAASADEERRAHTRIPGDEIPWLTGMRLKYGPSVRVIDFSRGGVQIEMLAHSLRPGATVVCEIAGSDKDLIVPARVLRCEIAQLTPEPSYRGSLAFKHALDGPSIDQALAPGASSDFSAIREHTRLTLALRRRADRRAARMSSDYAVAQRPDCLRVAADALNAALALVQAPAARRSGGRFERELAILFRTVCRGVDADLPAAMIVAALEDRVVRAVGLRSARLVPETSNAPVQEAVRFDVPGAVDRDARTLLVEFSPRQEPAEWQLHLLRSAGHLLALARDLDPREEPPQSAALPAASEADPAVVDVPPPMPAPEPAPGLQSRVVVRYSDGRLLKGYAREFLSSNGYVEVWPTAGATADARIRVPFGSVKAIFFVRDFDGNPNRVDAVGIADRGFGRPIAVTFLDDEVIAGRTMNYQPDGPGFFVTPDDPGANNERVFVVSRAVRHVRFG